MDKEEEEEEKEAEEMYNFIYTSVPLPITE